MRGRVRCHRCVCANVTVPYHACTPSLLLLLLSASRIYLLVLRRPRSATRASPAKVCAVRLIPQTLQASNSKDRTFHVAHRHARVALRLCMLRIPAAGMIGPLPVLPAAEQGGKRDLSPTSTVAFNLRAAPASGCLPIRALAGPVPPLRSRNCQPSIVEYHCAPTNPGTTITARDLAPGVGRTECTLRRPYMSQIRVRRRQIWTRRTDATIHSHLPTRSARASVALKLKPER